MRGWEEALSEGSSLSCGQTVENSDEAELCVRACMRVCRMLFSKEPIKRLPQAQ